MERGQSGRFFDFYIATVILGGISIGGVAHDRNTVSWQTPSSPMGTNVCFAHARVVINRKGSTLLPRRAGLRSNTSAHARAHPHTSIHHLIYEKKRAKVLYG